MAASQPTPVRPIVALFALANVGHALLAARYFFYAPIVFDVAIAACLGTIFLTRAR
jgi:hypothetical protein